MSRGTQVPLVLLSTSGTRLSLSMTRLPRRFPYLIQITCCGPTTPHVRKHTVWANPISLAATMGISIDLYSSGY